MAEQNNNNEITAKSLLGRLQNSMDAESSGEAVKAEVRQRPARPAMPPRPAAPVKKEETPKEPVVLKEEASAKEAIPVAKKADEAAPVKTAVVEDDTFEEDISDDDLVAPEFDIFEELEGEAAVEDEYEEAAEEVTEKVTEDDFVEFDEAEEDEYTQLGFADEDDFAELDGEGYEGDEYAEYADDVEDAEELVSAIDRLDVLEIAETGDDFDNDPLEAELDEAEEEYEEASDGEYDEVVDFENLVSQVVGDESEELTESDISLMVALGMEDELAKSIGEKDAVELTDDFIADQEEWVHTASHYGPDEYTDMSQNRKIAVDYTNKNKWSLIRLIAAALLTVVVLFYENMPVFGYQLAGALDPAAYPVVYVMMGLQLLFFMVAVAFPSVVKGAKSLFSLQMQPSAIAFVAAVAATLNTVHTAFGITAGVEPRLFNLPCAICLLMAVADEFFTNRREIFSFNIVSSKNPKYVMRRLNTKDSKLENQAVADMSEDNSGDIVKIAKTDFVEGYFWRTNNRGTVDKPFVTLLIILSAALSLVIGLYVLFTQRLGSAVETALTSLLTVLPASGVAIGFYPFYRANREAYYNDCTIVGEGSVEEYSDTEVISFDDVNVFPSVNVKVRNVRLFNNCRIDKVLYYASSVFAATGGPLADVFEVATMEMGHSEDVQIVDTGAGFIEAVVNGREILFAKEEALLSRGITIPENVLMDDEEASVDTSVMYMIYQGRLVSKMTLSYIVDADFEYIIRQLADSGMYVCVKTFDPNIDEELINRQVVGNEYPLRVIKYKGTEEITKYSARTEGGIVSRGTTKALLQTIAFCDKIVGAKKTGYVLSVIAAIFSVIIISAVVVMGKTDVVYSLYPAIMQLLWLIPTVLSTKIIVRQ